MSFLLVVIILSYVPRCQSVGQCVKQTFQAHEDIRATANPIQTFSGIDSDRCRRACRLIQECNGFNFIEEGTGICQLLSMNSPLGGVSVNTSSIFFYSCPSGLELWPYGEQMGCYIAVDVILLTWLEALDYCKTFHPQAHLVDLQTADEYSMVIRNIPVTEDYFWTSGLVQPEDIVWETTGKTADTSMLEWGSHEPDDYSDSKVRAVDIRYDGKNPICRTTPISTLQYTICEF